MLLKELRCVHFKNHTATKLHFADQLNVIVGPNGAGKTTILDAIHYLSLTRSHFSPVDMQHIQHGKDAFVIEGNFSKATKAYAIHCCFKKHDGKHFRNNAQPYNRLRDHIGLFPIVLSTPYDIGLIRGGSEGRRRWLDTMLCQLDVGYMTNLLQYQRLLKQRNSLLRSYALSGVLSQDLLDTYEYRLLPLNKQLYAARSTFLKTLAPSFQKYYQYFATTSERVRLVYVSSVGSSDFQQLFRDSLSQDRNLQRTTQGIHKDDIHLLLNDYPIKKIGSQGQQKSCIIALRLAQFAYIYENLQYKPLLLLDDIFESLDERRVDRLLQLMAQRHFGQIFITDAKEQGSTPLMQQVGMNPVFLHMEQGSHVPLS